MLNGQRGFEQEWYDEMYEAFAGFPNEKAIAAMRRWGVTHVVFHGGPIDVARFDALIPVASDGTIFIYRLR